MSGPRDHDNEEERDEQHGAAYEAQHVHAVYEQIASHFSSTRYKPWPIVERFLKEQATGAVGADIGCGNGKYLGVRRDVFIVGSDRSTNLTTIAASHTPHSAIVADNLSLPHPPGTFDFAISIAVIHHLSTPERRIEAVKCVLDVLRRPQPPSSGTSTKQSSATNTARSDSGGRALIYVWALEQKDSRRGWDEGHEQDVMVPWVLKQKKKEDQTFLRYYHLYSKGELERDVESAGGVVLEGGYEKDNWWVIAGVK